MSLLKYKYYDTPEGQDIYKKVFVTSKYAAISGLSYSVFDVLMYSHPKGILGTTARVAYLTGPLIGMAAAFSITANVSQIVRGKNDLLNYFLGGAAAGSIYGAWMKSITVAVPMGVFLGVCAMVKKAGIDNGWTFIPLDVHHMKENAWSVKTDWTFVKDLEDRKTWTKGPQ